MAMRGGVLEACHTSAIARHVCHSSFRSRVRGVTLTASASHSLRSVLRLPESSKLTLLVSPSSGGPARSRQHAQQARRGRLLLQCA